MPNIITARDFKNIAVITGGSSFINSVFWQDLSDSFIKAGIKFHHYVSIGETNPEKVDEIVEDLQNRNIDAVVAIGGGTVMDTWKAVSAMLCMSGSIVDYLEGVGTKDPTGVRKPLICIPTTSGTGSEVTKLSDYGFTENDLIKAAAITGLKNTPCRLETGDIVSMFLSRL